MVVAGCSELVFCVVDWGGAGKAIFCMSSMWFTFDVLDLVFMVSAGDREIGGEGESSPVIVGIGRLGPAFWPVLWKGEAALHVWCVGGVVPYSLMRGSMSSLCCDSRGDLSLVVVLWGGGGLLVLRLLILLGSLVGGGFGWVHGSGCGRGW